MSGSITAHRQPDGWSDSARRCGALTLLLCALLALSACGNDPNSAPDPKDAGIKRLRDALRANPDDASLRLELARLYLSRGDAAEAESHLRRADRLGASDRHLRGDLVRSMLLQNRHNEALQTIDAWLAATDAPPAGMLMLRGEAQLGLASYDRAVIQQSFIDAYRTLRASPDERVTASLAQLAQAEPLVAAARAHVVCQDFVDKPITPREANAQAGSGRVLRVGPTRRLTRPSQAAREARDGDLVEIEAGVYRGDVAVWPQHDLILRGVGGIARLEADGKSVQDKGIWVFDGDRITAENIAFSGARVKHKNGAGIRLQGTDVTIRNCHFYDNENGILGGSDPDNDVLVEFSTFERNGHGDGQSHNMYIGRARSFTLRFSYSHAAHIGHLVKSRAFENAILFNRLIDGNEGDGSYLINLPDGGVANIVGNELEQGPRAENPIAISIGEESAERDRQAYFVVNNTFYNRVLNGTFVRNATPADAVVANNLLAGAPAVLLRGPGSDITNTRRAEHGMTAPADHDYRLTLGAAAIDAGTNPLEIEQLGAPPDAEYVHPARGRARPSIAAIDNGAHEFCRFPEAIAQE